MQLYLTYSSPFARNVRIVVFEHGLQSCVSEHFSHPFHNGKELTSSNPLGKVPCLSLDDGTTIMDSEVICAYLDKQLGDSRLSKALDDDWNLKSLYSASAGLMETLVLRQVEKVREREGLASEFWWQRYNNAIVRTLNFFESRIAQFPDALSLLHINLGSALSYLDFRHEDFDWRNKRPQLAVFSKTLEALECFKVNTLRE